MIRAVEVKRCLAVTLFATIAVAAAAPVGAEEDKSDGKWHFTVTPYLWLPDISGTVTYTNPAGAGGSVTSQVDPSSYLESLDFAAMFTAEGRKDNWLVFTDYMYLHLGGHESAVKSVTGPGGIVTEPINTGGSTNIVGNIWTLAGGYTVLHKPDVSLDLFAGTRLLSLSTSLSWSFSGPTGALAQSGNVSQTMNEWDGIVGLKGEVRFGESKWFMPYYADIGAGSSNSTWQALLGVGYRFAWGDVVFVVRSLSYNFTRQQPTRPAHDRTRPGRVVQVLRAGARCIFFGESAAAQQHAAAAREDAARLGTSESVTAAGEVE